MGVRLQAEIINFTNLYHTREILCFFFITRTLQLGNAKFMLLEPKSFQ